MEIHEPEWWITRFESFGFRHSPYLTEQVRKAANEERDYGRKDETNTAAHGPDGQIFNAQHIWLNMQVFINAMVASLPQHAHLMAEHGCYAPKVEGKMQHKKCGSGGGADLESTLPPSFYPLELKPEQDQAWMDRMKQHIAEATNAQAANSNPQRQ